MTGASTGTAEIATPAIRSARNICHATDVVEKKRRPAMPQPSPAANAPATNSRSKAVTSSTSAARRR